MATVRGRTTLLVWGVAAAAVVAALLVVWLLRDGGADGAGIEAAGVLPADAEVVRFLDRAAASEELGLGEDDDADAYLTALQDAPWVATPLATHLAVAQDAPFDERDVDWWASVEVGDAAALNVYRMDGDVDLVDVADALAGAGFEESELGGHRRFKAGATVQVDASGLVDGIPVQGLLDVTVLEDAHLLVVGAEPERIVDVVDGDADALADEEGLAALTERTGVPLYALAYLGTDALCAQQVEVADGPTEAGLSTLGTPDARGLFVVADDGGVRTEAVLRFGSDDDAEDDARAREAWLEAGIDPVTNQPYADLLDAGSVEVDGDLVVVDVGDEAGLAVQVSEGGFGPIACS
jgi:hypothetical protein